MGAGYVAGLKRTCSGL